VQARLLLAIFDGVYAFALASWVGSVLFFSFGVAPVIFRVLGAEAGARFVRALFPRYYAWGVVSGAIALPALVAAPLTFPEYKGYWVLLQAGLVVAGILIFLYCGNSLTPAINAARDAGPDGSARFDRLHKRSVRLNAVALLIGIVLLVAHATRRPPTTEGTREMSPAERVEYDRQFEENLDDILKKGGTKSSPQPTGADGTGFRFDDAARRELEGLVAAKRDREARKRKGLAGGEAPTGTAPGPVRP